MFGQIGHLPISRKTKTHAVRMLFASTEILDTIASVNAVSSTVMAFAVSLRRHPLTRSRIQFCSFSPQVAHEKRRMRTWLDGRQVQRPRPVQSLSLLLPTSLHLQVNIFYTISTCKCNLWLYVIARCNRSVHWHRNCTSHFWIRFEKSRVRKRTLTFDRLKSNRKCISWLQTMFWWSSSRFRNGLAICDILLSH